MISGQGAGGIADSAEAAMRAGRLRPGDRLPPVRELAGRLRVSPTTVASAYRVLRLRGLVTAAGRRGTRVAARPPIAEAGTAAAPEGARELWLGNPDPALLPDLVPVLAATLARTRTLPLLVAFDRLGVPYRTAEVEPGSLVVSVDGQPVAVVVLVE